MRVLALAVLLATPVAAQEGDSGKGIFVACGYGGRRASSADGVHWEHEQELSPNGADDSNLLCDIAYGKGVFVAVGGGENVAPYWVTRDGKTWKDIHPGWKGRIDHIAFGNGRFVAGGGRLTWSEDGESWKLGVKIPYDKGVHLRHIVFGNGIFVGSGNCWNKEGTWYRVVTPDGETVTHFEEGKLQVRSMSFGAGRFVGVQGDGSIESSADGKAWELAGIEPDKGYGQILWTGTQFIVSGGKVALVSTDGRWWAKTSIRLPCAPIAGGGGVFVGRSYRRGLMSSVDAMTWTPSSLTDGNTFCAAAWGIPIPKPDQK